MRYLLLAIVVFALATEDAEARGRWRNRRSSGGNYSYSGGGASIYSTPQEAAEAKATMLAEAGRGWHPGGGFGGGYREGWGFSTVSAEAARWSTCYGGSCNSARGACQVWSPRAGGWFAINIW